MIGGQQKCCPPFFCSSACARGWHVDFDSFYLTNNNILTKKNKENGKKINLEEIVEKVLQLEMWKDRVCAACSTNTVVPALLPTERQPQAASQHFGLAPHQRAHWADVHWDRG